MSDQVIVCTFAIIGGGIAGVSCAEGISIFMPEESTVLITASPLIKTVTNIIPLGKTVMQFDIEEKHAETLTEKYPSLRVIHETVTNIDINEKYITTESGRLIKYTKLCLCTGGRAKLITENNKYVIGIRDTESVIQFSQKIQNARKIVVVGNGGIATELIHEVKNVDVVWVIKDKHISATFIDPGAAEFFLDDIYDRDKSENIDETKPVRRMRYTITSESSKEGGPALGPDWHNHLFIKGISSSTNRKIQIEYECEVKKILLEEEEEKEETECKDTDKWPVYVKLTNGKVIGCDFIVSATGVVPNSNLTGLENLEKGEDKGLCVDWKLETSEKDIYAAGDVCTARWDIAKHWFQMRLWTQAHQMGFYAAKSMTSSHKGEDYMQDFCFELFTHVTKFFDYKVVLIGLYNGQKLNQNYEILLRMTKKEEYIKLILENGKLQGAVLIGDTNLEEMCENLVLNQIDLTPFGDDILDPNIDIEDYFD
ncbi:PREDICTED: pyridine nucleotide-disulfide oxidoreductase domain-containing protein 1 [Polistes dominula]|uniref:Pyridine nucleotide-disulfide oxidoreductase domain-containing protein 1 n=1 Tax=Polistes dominula TaxID=743375 RepID=A0ABM1IVM3_POLDO|nr:PREDICTED: pyridine nucleotide-disulfide oxidoreductase domain-containing protein 1 [Polistes dominula]